jgi:hypothetical protein
MSTDSTESTPARGPLDHVHLAGRELETYNEFMHLDPLLADVFLQGHRLAQSTASPASGLFLSHAGRELTNGLVKRLHLTGAAELTATVRGDGRADAQKDALARCLAVPRDHPVVSRWHELHQVFLGAVHYPSTGEPFDRIRSAFLDLSDLLYGRVALFISTSEALAELIALDSPGPEDVPRLGAFFTRSQHRILFFANARSPKWVDLLSPAGLFDAPPQRLIYPDGRWRIQHWPEGGFLARMTAERPREVAAILASLPETNDNPGVWTTVVDAALHLEGELAGMLGQKVSRALRVAIPVLLPHKAIGLVAHLASLGQTDAAFGLTNELLRLHQPHPDDSTPRPRQNRNTAGAECFSRIDGYDLESIVNDALPALTGCDPQRTCVMLAGILKALIVAMASTAVEDAGETASSHRWCDNLATSDRVRDARGLLAHALATAIERAIVAHSVSPDTLWDSLRRHSGDIFDRIRLHLLTIAGPQLQGELDAIIGNETILEPCYYARERASLLRAQFVNASPDARARLVAAIIRGPLRDGPPNAQASASAPGDEEEHFDPALALQSQIDTIADWQRRRLRWFHDCLPDDLRELAEQLEVTPEVPDARDQALNEDGHYVGGAFSWRGSRSPITSEHFASMSTAEIAAYLSNWTPPASTGQDPFDVPSSNGLADTLRSFVAADSERGTAVLAAMPTSGTSQYRTAILAGLKKALENDSPIDWTAVLTAAELHGAGNSFAVPPGTGGDVEQFDGSPIPETAAARRGLFRATMELLTAGCNGSSIPYEEAHRLWALVASLAASPVVWDEPRSNHAAATVEEAMSASWNSAAGDATAFVIATALWAYRHRVESMPVEAPARVERAAEIEALAAPIFEGIFARPPEVTLGPRSLLGQQLPQVMLVVPEWLEGRIEALLSFSERTPLRHHVWGSYLARGRLYRASLDRLAPWYSVTAVQMADLSSLTSDERTMADRQALEGLVAKILGAMILGWLELALPEGVIPQVVSKAPPKVLAHAYWEIFRGWSDAEEPVPAESAERLARYWRWRLECLERSPVTEETSLEIDGLRFLIATPYLPVATTLEFGLRTIVLGAGRGRTTGAGWERMAELAAADPDETFALVDMLAREELSGNGLVLFDQIAPALRTILQLGASATRENAVRLVSALCEHGQEEFRALVTTREQ